MRFLLSFLFVFWGVLNAPYAQTETITPEVSAAGLEKDVAHENKSNLDIRSESDIPLNFDENKKATTQESGFFRVLFTLSILALVGMGAFYFLRKYSVPKGRKHQTQIKVLQQHYLGPKKSLAIVRVAGESILIGVTDHNISLIKALSLLDDEVPDEAPQNFVKVLKGHNSQDNFVAADVDEADSQLRQKMKKDLDVDEEFAISGIKDIVSRRLKGMRSLQ
jgi:flagellar protein FliO/FliZ